MNEERIIYGILAGVGGVASAGELSQHETIGTFATVALMMMTGGIVGMVHSWLRRPRLPQARVIAATGRRRAH